ncbi:zinc ribbon domain-containing protein [Gammaproteobacteria bacterium 2W06]|uniref:FmdB family zinc ribbon protein n=1 Tax=Spiribacter roseus TaxID=1855875 RepID=UPI000D843F82|nr:zinc ribbon domain-containing protein [Spiribacter roseus]AUB77860.1 FmdB family transcriptional regulator [Spiribacter roseus]KAF0281284.1 FmdB family transcriptional regulator [Spiribacter roseus]PZA01139.1 zinc ribbon domain-containing protein [Gammaproteobacteria bacterium 2W06]
MPIYEYVCDDCRHELEALQGMNDAVLTECPECGHAALRRKISAAAFRLKGSGWYETDFKKDNQRNLAGDQAASAKSEGKSAEGGRKDGGKSAAAGKDNGAGKGSGKASGGSAKE